MFENVPKCLNCLKDLFVRRVEWRKSETHIVGISKVGDDLHLLNERLINPVAFGMTERYVRSSFAHVTRRSQHNAERLECMFEQFDEVFTLLYGFRAQFLDTSLVYQIDSRFDGGERKYRWRSGKKFSYRIRGFVLEFEVKLIAVAEPSSNRI